MTEKTEKEKMIAGELYFSADPELVADRKHAKQRQLLINQTTDLVLKRELVKETFGQVKNQVHIEANLRFDYGYNISVGKNFYANYDCVLLDICPITIGDNCMLAPNVKLYTASHPIEAAKRNSGLENGAPISLGDNVWIGGNATLLPGVTLGDNVVVGAGSVVTRSFPADVVIAGNPARVIRSIETGANFNELTRETQQIDSQLIDLLEKRMQLSNKSKVQSEETWQNISQLTESKKYQHEILAVYTKINELTKKVQEG